MGIEATAFAQFHLALLCFCFNTLNENEQVILCAVSQRKINKSVLDALHCCVAATSNYVANL